MNDAKQQYRRLQDRILGSSAQLGYGDTQMYLASPEETGDPHYTFLVQSHIAKVQSFSLGRDDGGLFVPWAESTQNLEEGKILACIPPTEAGIAFAEIIVAAEASKTTVHRYLQELLKEGHILKAGHGRYRRAPVN